MNATNTPMSAAEFMLAFPDLFQSYQNLILLETAYMDQWRQSDTAFFDGRIQKAQKDLTQAESNAQSVYRARIADEFALMENTNRDGLARLNAQLADLLAKLDEDEAPILQARDAEVARLRAVWASLEQTCEELDLDISDMRAAGVAEHEAAARAAGERCDAARAPLRERYSAQVQQAYAEYNAVLAQTRIRYDQFENGVFLDRKRALASAERMKHDALQQIAAERDEAARERRGWWDAQKMERKQVFLDFLQTHDRDAERQLRLTVRTQQELLEELAGARGWQLPEAWTTQD